MALAGAGAAAIAGVGAAAAYLDAKYHIRKDLATIQDQKIVQKDSQLRAKKNQISTWYMFEEQVLARRDAPCLWYRKEPTDTPTSYTWTQTYDATNQYGRFLLDNGVQPGELVGTYLINSPEFIFNMLGSWTIGCGAAWINYNLGGEGLIHCLKVAATKVLIVDEDEGCQQRVQEVKEEIEKLGMRIIILDAATRAQIAQRDSSRLSNEYRNVVKGNSPVFIFYTSGTTGYPKACPFEAQRAGAFGQPRLRVNNLKAGDVWYDCMPFYHGTGGTVTIGCLISGITLAIGRKFSVRNFWKDIHDSEANAFVYVGETARYLLAAPPSPLDKDHKLRSMYGNGMRPDVWIKFQERFNIPIVNEFFNSTEGVFQLLNTCRGPFHAAHVGHHGAILRRRFHSIYVPVEIDHENGDRIWRDPHTGFARRKTYDEGGEIIIACQSEKDFVGYWNNPEATEKRFERNVFRPGDLYYRTGDALRRDPDGRWYFLDRLGDTFRWKSENVSTAQVAEVLGQFPGLVEANVYGVEIPGHDGRAGCAAIFIRPDERATFDYAGLVAHVRKVLPKYAVPLFLRLIQNPTPMHNNKQNKVPLRKEGVDPHRIATGEAGPGDSVLWLPSVASKTYVPFRQEDWDNLAGGQVRL